MKKRMWAAFTAILLIAFLLQVAWTQPVIEGTGYDILRAMKEGRLPASASLDGTDDDTGYDALHYNIELELNPTTEYVEGEVSMDLEATEDNLSVIQMDLRYNLEVDDVWVDGLAATFSHDNYYDLDIDLATPLNTGDQVTVTVAYHGNPEASGSMGGLYWHEHQGTDLIASLSQPEGAKRWWPCKDIPSDKATARMVWTVPDWMVAAGNGNLVSVTEPTSGWKSYEWVEDYAISTYLISIASTNYTYWQDWYVNAASDSLPLDYYIYPEDSAGSHIDFVDIPEMIGYFATVFGEYPFMEEKYGMSEFEFGGAMEHQTLTSMGDYFVNGWGPQFNNWIYAHELAHMWWGDMLTCATWMDIWLNEGFAMYADALWHGHQGGMTAYHARIDEYCQEYIEDEPGEGRFPIYDPVEMWGVTVYEKGGIIMHMLRYVLGDDDFFAALLEWRDRYEFDAATTAQWQETLEDVSATDMDWFFDEWVYMAGYPEYNWGWQYEDLGNDSSRVDVSIAQVQSTANQTPEVFTMPIQIGIQSSQGYFLETVQNDQRHQLYSFVVPGYPGYLEFDPDNWILKIATMTGYVGVEEIPTQPETFELSLSVLPNPANPEAQILFTLPHQQHAAVSVYNLQGRRVATLFDGLRAAGTGQITWQPQGIASGLYLVRLETPDGQIAKKLMILK